MVHMSKHTTEDDQIDEKFSTPKTWFELLPQKYLILIYNNAPKIS
jgi:hypothetical protein